MLEWTTDLPTSPGYYWIRFNHNPKQASVERLAYGKQNRGLQDIIGVVVGSNWIPLEEYGDILPNPQWWGPLEQPE